MNLEIDFSRTRQLAFSIEDRTERKKKRDILGGIEMEKLEGEWKRRKV